MRILITGGKGQLGQALVRRAAGHDILAPGRSELDVSRPEAREAVREMAPDLVVNAAAMTNVDACEGDEAGAYRLNALGARYVALGAEAAGAALVQVSTDFVFDGGKGAPYREFDPPSPASIYGASKAAGETEAFRACRRTYVARTAWLFGQDGRNFVTKMLELSESRPSMKVVVTEVGCPTYCDDLADAILALAGTQAYGLYHLVSEGHCSRHAFARAILTEAGKPDYPIEPVDHFPRQAPAPEYAPLLNQAAAELGIQLPAWQDALGRYMAHLRQPASAA